MLNNANSITTEFFHISQVYYVLNFCCVESVMYESAHMWMCNQPIRLKPQKLIQKLQDSVDGGWSIKTILEVKCSQFNQILWLLDLQKAVYISFTISMNWSETSTLQYTNLQLLIWNLMSPTWDEGDCVSLPCHNRNVFLHWGRNNALEYGYTAPHGCLVRHTNRIRLS